MKSRLKLQENQNYGLIKGKIEETRSPGPKCNNCIILETEINQNQCSI
jgi:hypothetical protein